jgi:SAM-dependent methyltransferase
MNSIGGSVSTLVVRPRVAASQVFARMFRDWAGVPSGPLGWVSAHTALNSGPGSYPAVADALHLDPNDDLLELGCGSAGFLAGQADRVHRVAGIDLSDIQVGLARKRLGARIAAGTAEIVHGDAAALPWPDAAFTVVTCMSVFEAFPDPSGVLDEVFRVLRPGGRAVLNIGERVEPGTQTHRVLNDSAWVWAEDDVRRMVQQAGFADVTIQYVPWGEDTAGNRLFAKAIGKVVGPITGDLRLAGGIKP